MRRGSTLSADTSTSAEPAAWLIELAAYSRAPRARSYVRIAASGVAPMPSFTANICASVGTQCWHFLRPSKPQKSSRFPRIASRLPAPTGLD